MASRDSSSKELVRKRRPSVRAPLETKSTTLKPKGEKHPQETDDDNSSLGIRKGIPNALQADVVLDDLGAAAEAAHRLIDSGQHYTLTTGQLNNIDKELGVARHRYAKVRAALSGAEKFVSEHRARDRDGLTIEERKQLFFKDAQNYDTFAKSILKKVDFVQNFIREFIDTRKQIASAPLEERISELSTRLRDNPSLDLSFTMRLLFPELWDKPVEVSRENSESNSAAPSREAPIDNNAPRPSEIERPRWADRDRSEGLTAIDFVRRHYGSWNDGEWSPNGLTMANLRHDVPLYNAVTQFNRHHPDEAIPTKKQVYDTWAEQILAEPDADEKVRELRRQLRNLERRQRQL